jgi:hypothetical protein
MNYPNFGCSLDKGTTGGVWGGGGVEMLVKKIENT